MTFFSRLFSTGQASIVVNKKRRRLTGVALVIGLVVAMSAALLLNPFDSRAQVNTNTTLALDMVRRATRTATERDYYLTG